MVFSTHEAQKFQAIKWMFRMNHPPKMTDSPTIDHVNHTVIVPPADFTRAVFPESVVGEPAVESTAKQSNKSTRRGVFSDFIEVFDPIASTNRAFPTKKIVAIPEVFFTHSWMCIRVETRDCSRFL